MCIFHVVHTDTRRVESKIILGTKATAQKQRQKKCYKKILFRTLQHCEWERNSPIFSRTKKKNFCKNYKNFFLFLALLIFLLSAFWEIFFFIHQIYIFFGIKNSKATFIHTIIIQTFYFPILSFSFSSSLLVTIPSCLYLSTTDTLSLATIFLCLIWAKLLSHCFTILYFKKNIYFDLLNTKYFRWNFYKINFYYFSFTNYRANERDKKNSVFPWQRQKHNYSSFQ